MAVALHHWVAFLTLIALIIAYDLWRFINPPHTITMREAAIASAGWILLAFVFNGWIYTAFGYQPALDFFTGYLL